MKTIDLSTYANRIAGIEDDAQLGLKFIETFPLGEQNPSTTTVQDFAKHECDTTIPSHHARALSVVWALAHTIRSEKRCYDELINVQLRNVISDPKNPKSITGLTKTFFKEMPIDKPRKDTTFISAWLYTRKYQLSQDRLRAFVAAIDVIRIALNPEVTAYKVHFSYITHQDIEVFAENAEEAITLGGLEEDAEQQRQNMDEWEISVDPME